MKPTHITGQTKDVGFEIGVRRTFPVSIEQAWNILFSDEGLKLWLGDIPSADFIANERYRTKERTEGVVKVFKPNSHVRFTWKKIEWDNISTVQIRVIEAKGGTTISFHQENLLGSVQRDEMRKHWEEILEKIAEKLQVSVAH